MDTGQMDESIQSAISRKVKSAILSAQQDMFNNLTTVIESKLPSFQSNIQQSQAEI